MDVAIWPCRLCGKDMGGLPLREIYEHLCDECMRSKIHKLHEEWNRLEQHIVPGETLKTAITGAWL